MEPRKMMAFIDGENLVFRYQSMIRNGWLPVSSNFHEADNCVWSGFVPVPNDHFLIRANYYTSVVGDDNKIETVFNSLKQQAINGSSSIFSAGKRQIIQGAQNLFPVVFKKPSRSNKTKIIDIRMTVDILSNVYQNNIDSVYLISGDGDYEEVIKEIIRMGKRIYISALSDGLNPKLRKLSDECFVLDPFFFKER
jgi:uncharacterized LabA/DUF88 family protein